MQRQLRHADRLPNEYLCLRRWWLPLFRLPQGGRPVKPNPMDRRNTLDTAALERRLELQRVVERDQTVATGNC